MPAHTGLTPGGVLHIVACTGRLRQKGGTFFGLQVYKRVGISQVEGNRVWLNLYEWAFSGNETAIITGSFYFYYEDVRARIYSM